jgi:hypothetical protein
VEAEDGVRAWGGEDCGDAVESHGADEAVVVVGVFADEVDAAGGLGEEEVVGCDAGEVSGELLAKSGDIHRKPPIKTDSGENDRGGGNDPQNEIYSGAELSEWTEDAIFLPDPPSYPV